MHGFARGTHENIANAKKSRIVWVFILATSWFWWQLFELHTALYRKSDLWWTIGCVGITLLWMAYHALRRFSTEHPGLVQVRLNVAGCVQFDDLGGPSLLRDLWKANLWVVPIAAAIALIVGLRLGGLNPVAFWMFLILALIAMPFVYRYSHRFRRAIRQVREGAVADINAALCPPTSWKDVRSFAMKPSRGGYRLTINTDTAFLSAKSAIPVDAELQLNGEQAASLQEMIRKWIAQFRHAGR
ncbi:MAG TPA: hypothetical protein VFE47_25130 [Tepidisphaeraceae bacterium]|nr:hypothetical protein [Tepidisphaeraceae bacterium]